ncbi:hypothetical protein ENUP19_0266G0001 [Entamoeba nuttalli]|uniref:CULT domain-containing protein n=2 Tax=Entamoeba nuttalli TaxID=412467 RepID=K2HVJ9_ENTNP|nr:hypothetical protein ENU1_096040 [Entamoeba nuttalli P19]EKE40275.1 hypothetical protein ENU1_096040 [Entamoeba nuttalli P19]|eukprot:XP_008857396.1 hypothetical protein ENU1_096040 [Entamoeba nuttalli P19]
MNNNNSNISFNNSQDHQPVSDDESSDEEDFFDILLQRIEIIRHTTEESELEVESDESINQSDNEPERNYQTTPLTYSYLLSQNYIPPNEGELTEHQLVVPLIIGNVFLQPETTAPFILRGGLCGTFRQLLRSSNGILRACIINEHSFETSELKEVYGCIGNVIKYEDHESSIAIIFKGIKRCKLITNNRRETIIPIGKVEIIPDMKDINYLYSMIVNNGCYGYQYWKLHCLEHSKKQIIDFIKKIEGDLISEQLESIQDTNEFLTAVHSHLPLSIKDELQYERAQTVEDAIKICIHCIQSTQLKCACCNEFNIKTIFCPTENIFSISTSGISSNHVNPSGFTFTVTTAIHCSNLRVETQPSYEFSWFEGYAWQIIVCKSCESHIGWKFTTQNDLLKPKVFYGLRSDCYIVAQ